MKSMRVMLVLLLLGGSCPVATATDLNPVNLVTGPVEKSARKVLQDAQAVLSALIDQATRSGELLIRELAVQMQGLITQATKELEGVLDTSINKISNGAQRKTAEALFEATQRAQLLLDKTGKERDKAAVDLNVLLGRVWTSGGFFVQSVDGLDQYDDGREGFPLTLYGPYLGLGTSGFTATFEVVKGETYNPQDQHVVLPLASRGLGAHGRELILPRRILSGVPIVNGKMRVPVVVRVTYRSKNKIKQVMDYPLQMQIFPGEAGTISADYRNVPVYQWVKGNPVVSTLVTGDLIGYEHNTKTFQVQLPQVEGKSITPKVGDRFYNGWKVTCASETVPANDQLLAKFHKSVTSGNKWIVKEVNACLPFQLVPYASSPDQGPPVLNFKSQAFVMVQNDRDYQVEVRSNSLSATFTVQADLWQYTLMNNPTGKVPDQPFRYNEPVTFSVPVNTPPFTITLKFKDGRVRKLSSTSGGDLALGVQVTTVEGSGVTHYVVLYQPINN